MLQHYDIEVIYSMNESSLKKIYKLKSEEGRGEHKFKPRNADWMLIEDCISLLRTDCNLHFSSRILQEAFSLSKHDVISEFDRDSLQNYHKMSYLEFLEFLSRFAELYFEGSEMEELELHQKLEFLLDEILPVVGAKRVKQTTVIEEFSESDDDY